MEQETTIESRNMLPIGATLQGGKYHVDKHLSSGGFGNTYVVTNTKFDETFAMKEFFMKDVCERDGRNTVSVSNSGNQDSFDQQRAKFNKEAQRIRKFNNPHIVKVHDLFDENGTSYYIMDYIDGASLSDRMKQTGKRFSEQDVRRFLPQILDGLDEVHKQNIWHLDLHPKNIMLDKAGNIVLIDFGASKQLNPDNRFSTSSAFCYHQGYAPSEQIDQNINRIGAWTDLYALGATLYNLLTMQPPLSTSEIQDGETFTYPRPVSKEMQELIKKMMLPNRKERPQSVGDVCAFLRQDAEVTIVADAKDSDEDKTKYTVETPTANAKDSGKKTNTNNQDRKPNRTNIRNIIIAAVLAAISVVGVVFFVKNRPASTDEPVEQTDETVQHYAVKSAQGKLLYYWTGSMNEGQPEGEGVIEYAPDDNDGRKEYKGTVTKGMRNDDSAVLTYTNGNSYNGSFQNDNLNKGKLVLKSDGMYFEGTFRDNQPYNGKWYFTDGTYYSTVTNGIEK